MSYGIGQGVGGSAEAQQTRCACLLLLDTSAAMSGQRIDQLNAGLMHFKQALYANAQSAQRVDVGIVSFGPVRTVTEFVSADRFYPPFLVSTADTPIGAAIEQGVDMVRQRTQYYQANGLGYYRPWIFLVTAGAPSDSWRNAAELVRQGEASKDFQFFAVGMEGADMEALAQISVRAPLKLKEVNFRELFDWLSASMDTIARSSPGDTVPLINPTAAGGWALA
ncbi:VWA domain-containing protein [Stenotrophomonas terrae]|uniref:vWA domain-containing protein n=1 Tax=Stenotrophomonas terrae TaxID=405446 RepID=UPI00320944B8